MSKIDMTATLVRRAARIYDDSNHENYGPVRRLWVMMKQLDVLDHADAFFCEGPPWDEVLSIECNRLKVNFPLTYEKLAQRHILYLALDHAVSGNDVVFGEAEV